jgi:hypothetical protein
MANDNERNDVSLCFQALGIDFGAAPEEVEKAYQRMVAEIKKKQASPDPTVRTEAAKDLELAYDLYEKIRNSITYSSKLQEADKLASIKQGQQKKETVQQYQICPSCKKTIGATFKKCPYCRQPILTPLEKFINALFSLKAAVILVVLIALIAGVTFLINPGLFKWRKAEPVQEMPPAIFSTMSGNSFGNLSGATTKP